MGTRLFFALLVVCLAIVEFPPIGTAERAPGSTTPLSAGRSLRC
jgi:hypothetical protein